MPMEIVEKQPTAKGIGRVVHRRRLHRRHHPPGRPYPGTGPPVHFTPGARTAWHEHCNGQTLRVTEGIELTQVRGGEVVVIQRGDTGHLRRHRPGDG